MRLTTLPLILTLFLLGCGKEAPPEEKPSSFPVTTVTVEKEDVPVAFEFIADTQSSHLVNIQARVNGFLDERVYTEGEIVKKGQVLFVMDKKPFIAQLDAAQAALEMKQAAKETARLTYNRTKPLTELNALSQKDLDDATGALESASAAVEMAKANVETAKLNLSYCTIFSPIDGITGAAAIQNGTYLNVLDSQLTTVSALDPMWVNFSLSENQMQKIRREIAKGTLIPPEKEEYSVEVFMIDGSPFPYRGKITFAQPYYNPDTGTFLLRASVDNPKSVLRPHMYVRVKVHGAVRPNSILVPQRAVRQSSKGHFVWINKNGKADFRPVTVGDWYQESWFITEGLFPGDQVITDGAISLYAGAPVEEKQAE